MMGIIQSIHIAVLKKKINEYAHLKKKSIFAPAAASSENKLRKKQHIALINVPR